MKVSKQLIQFPTVKAISNFVTCVLQESGFGTWLQSVNSHCECELRALSYLCVCSCIYCVCLAGDIDITESVATRWLTQLENIKGKTTELTGMHALFSVGLCSKIRVGFLPAETCFCRAISLNRQKLGLNWQSSDHLILTAKYSDMLVCTSEAKFIINSTIVAICTMIVNELYKEKQNNVLFVYCKLRQFLTDIVLWVVSL